MLLASLFRVLPLLLSQHTALSTSLQPTHAGKTKQNTLYSDIPPGSLETVIYFKPCLFSLAFFCQLFVELLSTFIDIFTEVCSTAKQHDRRSAALTA